MRPNLADLAFGEPSKAIYVIEAGASVKIGVSNNPASRARALQVGQDREVRVFWAVRLATKQATAIEAALHKRMRSANTHMRGEWYVISPQEARAVIEREIAKRGVKSQVDLEFGIR